MANIDTLYEELGIFGNRETACGLFALKVPELGEKTPDEIADILADRYDKNDIIYFGTNYRKADSHLGAEYLWIPSGFADIRGEQIYTQFVKGAFAWQGAFVGNATDIVKHQIAREDRGKSKKEMQNNLSVILGTYKHTIKREEQETEQAAEQTAEQTTEQKAETSVQVSSGTVKKAVLKNVIIVGRDKTTETTAATKPSVVSHTTPKPLVVDESGLDTLTLSADEEPFYKAFYDRLLVKVGWSPELIKSYLYTMVYRENYLLSTGRGEEYIIRSQEKDGKQYAMMNTALLNSFGNPIKLIIRFWGTNPSTPLGYTCNFWTICDGKVSALSHNFTKEDLNKDLRPVVFYDNDPKELVFDADIDDFDLENEARLGHCIDRKAERDNKTIVNLTDNQIYASIVQAIRTAVAISKYDNSYVKPIYYRSTNCINFVIPYHINGRFDTTPELGVIVSKGPYGLWQVMTVLGYDEVCCDCNCLTPYRASSF